MSGSSGGGGSTTRPLRSLGPWDELVKLGIVGRQAQAWQLQLEGLRGLDGLTDHDPVATFPASLRPYQPDGFKWLATLWELGLGGILADDMGLGKTIQALALATHVIDAGAGNPFLVVAPTFHRRDGRP